MNKKRFLLAALSLLLSLCCVLPAMAAGAAEYPRRQIELVVPYSAGGGTDLVARAVAGYLSKSWGQPISVINQSGVIAATREALNARPDGYTAVVIPFGELTTTIAANTKPPFGIDKITFIARLSKYPVGFTVKGDAPWKNFKEFSDWVVEDPTRLTWGSGSMSSPAAFIVADWMNAIGADFKKARMVSITGAADSATKVAGGHITLQIGDILGAKALADAGKLRVLAVSPYRNDLFPDIPTAEENGVSGLTFSNGVGLLMPAGVPREIVEKWNGSLEKMYADPEFLDSLKSINAIAGYMGSGEYEEFVKEQVQRNTELAEKLGLRK